MKQRPRKTFAEAIQRYYALFEIDCVMHDGISTRDLEYYRRVDERQSLSRDEPRQEQQAAE